MTEVVEGPAAAETEAAGDERLSAQVGASSFSDLVRAHYDREKERAKGRAHQNGADGEFAEKLARFEQEEGKLAAVYWATRNASAVAMTVGAERHKRNPIADTDAEVRLHRVTDWVARGAEPIAELLHECDVLAIRVREVLRGTSERIAMQWIYSVQEHALGFLERRDRRHLAKEQEFVRGQRRELARIEQYYLRTGAKAGRIVYVSGMVAAASFIVFTCAALAIGLSFTGLWGGNVEALLLCTGAGAVGALVSVLSRMSLGDERFTIDFEVGRPLLRRLGLYKPFVGSVFSVATYFLLAGGLLPTQQASGDPMFFYGIIGFLAGFSERFTGVIFGNAERLVGGDPQAPQAQPQPELQTQAPSDGDAPTEPDAVDGTAVPNTG
jgi:gluconate kinase